MYTHRGTLARPWAREYGAPVEDRIVELEVRLAYQDKIIADLDEVVRTFSERVVRLEREIELIKETVKSGGPEVGPQDEKPPHY